MEHVSLMEVLHPLGIYVVIGMYHATISGYVYIYICNLGICVYINMTYLYRDR